MPRNDESPSVRGAWVMGPKEALTAKDRPYKPGMKLSQAMGIMNKFKLNGHIDPDLFDIFVSKGVYQSYAERFLDPWQIDEVNPVDWQR